MKASWLLLTLVIAVGSAALGALAALTYLRQPDSGAEKLAAEVSASANRENVAPVLSRGPDAGGYIVIPPMLGRQTYLINRKGEVVHRWPSPFQAGRSAYLLPDGNLLRAGRAKPYPAFQSCDGIGGRIQILAPDGAVIWDYFHGGENHAGHHDIEPLPNGNILLLSYERITAGRTKALGRDPTKIGEQGLLIDTVVEIRPSGEKGAEVVWKWSPLDHSIQDIDPKLSNYGKINEHPELLDINHAGQNQADWLYFNSIDYNAERDQILLSCPAFSEIWVIDRSTTTDEAASHAGGRSGKGGDLLYRWGNPRAWKQGDAAQRKLYQQHDARWVAGGYPGEGNITIFNNGWGRPDTEHSVVEEIALPAAEGTNSYQRNPGEAFGPDSPTWRWGGMETGKPFFAQRLSSAQRLPNGNTLICLGPRGALSEVTPDGKVVWSYVSNLGPADRPQDARDHRANSNQFGSARSASSPAPFGRTAIFSVQWYASDDPGIVALFQAKAAMSDSVKR